jgi:hypothetical protein
MSPRLSVALKFDPEYDIALIKSRVFLDSNPYLANRIFAFYKDLSARLSTTDQAERPALVDAYFRGIYEREHGRIAQIFEESQEIIRLHAQDALDTLVSLMDYEVKENEEFIGIPSLLPFSPFQRPYFSFSISFTLYKNVPNDVLVAIHEISHFLFFDILDDLKISLNDDNPEWKEMLHIFKEALTGMLLTEPEIMLFLGGSAHRRNAEIEMLFVSDSSGVMPFLKYLRDTFHGYKNRGQPFQDFIQDILNKLMPHTWQFSEKRQIWKQHGHEIAAGSPDLCRSYKEPIAL